MQMSVKKLDVRISECRIKRVYNIFQNLNESLWKPSFLNLIQIPEPECNFRYKCYALLNEYIIVSFP